MSRVSAAFRDWYAPIREDVFKFCDALAFKPTWQQRDALLKVQDAATGRGLRNVAVKSGRGPGKTTISGVSGLWLAIRNIGAMIIVTAPTMHQCKDVWLTELRRTVEAPNVDPWVRRIVNITKTRVSICGQDDWGVRLITASTPEAIAGLHERNMSIIFEEASGIDRVIYESIIASITNQGGIALAIGNPTTRDGWFFDCFNGWRHRWATYTMNAEKSPIVDPERLADMREQYGENSDYYRVQALGEFPHSDPQSVMSSEDLAKCAETSVIECVRMSQARQFGIDLARYGGDEATIFRRSGNAIVEHWARPKVEPTRVIDVAFKMQAAAGWKNDGCLYVPDASGMGQGVLGKLYDAGRQVYEFHNGSCATVKDYENKVTEAWFRFAVLVKAIRCHIPNDNRLIQQLATRKYHTTKKGKIVLESKEDYVKRGYDSPDRADGLVMAFWDRSVAEAKIATVGKSARDGVGGAKIIRRAA